MKRRALAARRKTKAGEPSITILDAKFSLFIRGIANNECQAWGWRYKLNGGTCSAQMQCAHLKSRRFTSIRWDQENAICLCAACHAFFTDHPDFFTQMVDELWPGRWDAVQSKWLTGKGPTSHEKRELLARLNCELEGLN